MKHLLFSILALAAFRTGLAQGPFPFPRVAEWIVYKVYGIIGPEDYFVVYRDYVSGQDSVFEGKTYTVAWRQDLCSCTCVEPGYGPSFNQVPFILGGIREEAGKVYYTRFGGDGTTYFRPVHDTLLFDFTVQPGDTILYANQTSLAVTDVTEDLEGRKTIHLKILPLGVPRTWVEGQGSAGLFETLEWFNQNGSCFSVEQPSTCPVPCEVVTAVGEPRAERGIISVRPTLATDWVEVDIPLDWQAREAVIYGSDGRLLARYPDLREDGSLDVSALPPGVVYLVAISHDDRRAVARFIKQ